MKRREFITLLGGAAAAWPLAARAQQPERMRRLGVLMGRLESDTEGQARMAAFWEQFQKLGWMEGRTIRIDIRWQTPDADSLHRFAKELVALQPDVILSESTPPTAALLTTNAHHPNCLRRCFRSDRLRLRREPGAAGRQRHRVSQYRGFAGRQVDGVT